MSPKTQKLENAFFSHFVSESMFFLVPGILLYDNVETCVQKAVAKKRLNVTMV